MLLRFLVSSQPFFIFSSCLMSIIKREGSSESTFSKKRVRRFTSLTNFVRCSLNWKNVRHHRSGLGTRLWMNFSTYHGIILEVATTEEHNKREISVVGRSGCGLSINMKYVGKERIPVQNSGGDVEN